MANLKGKDGAFLVLFKDDRKEEVFLIYRTDYPIWVLTGGGIEDNETAEEAAVREAIEETGFEVRLIRYVGEYQYRFKKTYLYEGRYVSGVYKPEFGGNIGQWFSINNLPKDVTSATKQKVLDAAKEGEKPFVKIIANELPLKDNLPIFFRHPLAFFAFVYKAFIKKP